MCDLIDLNSPNVRGSLELAKLASPLIPAPKSVENGDEAGSKSVTERREGEGNNPFDQVLHETAEYVSKKGDPFEVMLQRALRSKGCRSARSVDFTDDYTPRKKRYLKAVNKTLSMLDESLLESGFGFYDENGKREARVKTESGDIDARNVDVCDNNGVDNASVFKQKHKISVVDSDSLELSILNQSAMNDALLEVIPKKNGKVSLSPEKDSFKERIFPSNIKHFKLSHTQRSLSEKQAAKSPTELPCLYERSQSVTDVQRKTSLTSGSNSTISLLDRGFLERQSDQSVFSSLSNISSITKLTPTSLSSLVLSIDPMNHAFVDDSSLKTSQKMNTIESSVDIKSRQYDLSDLAERFNKLKCSINDMTSILSITDKDDSSSTKGESNNQIANNKLIDVDVFVPEQNKNFNRSSSSTCSSDSVFTNNKVDKSILYEAKELAKTFEELALNSESVSVDDDLISNNTMWMSELLPAFEDEPVVNDLIHLPTSPEEYSGDRNNHKNQSPTSINSAEGNSLKEMELSFGVSVVKQDITSLLSDLRKLVKPDSNPEAKKLLDNLESILNINYKNNTELLVTCLNTSNKSQSPQKTSLDSIERFDKSNIDKNEEESGKVSSQEKICNDEKSLTDINCKKLKDTDRSQDKSPDVLSIEKSSVTSSFCKDKSESQMNITESSDLTEDSTHKAKEGDSQVDKKIAIELLVNLKKLLSGQSKDDTTIQLLKNIGKVLNTALNDSPESEIQAKRQNIQTTPVKAQKSDYNAHSSTHSARVAHRQSLESKSKTVRRSISAVIESSPKSMQIRRRRDTSELESKQKRFSSDPGFINTPSNKKLMNQNTCNTRKAEAARPDSRKEKSIGINDVKNKLKKRSDTVNKKGPMKAVHPADDMQKKRASIGRQRSSQITPPKSNKIISSTPVDNNHYGFKKSAKSKPIASSTPDGQNSKSAPLTSSNKKRNFSCDISPVTTDVNISDERKYSPKRMSKLPTPKKCTTPTRQQTDGIPRFLTPPRNYSSLNTNNPRSPQRLNRSSISFQRYSPLSEKKNVEKVLQQSPLKEVNRIISKVKPRNLISKIKRHSIGDFTEKENHYARE